MMTESNYVDERSYLPTGNVTRTMKLKLLLNS